eukprot:COSAG01_NODE_7058_length_3373_cov_1.332010_3_plen_177_part_00
MSLLKNKAASAARRSQQGVSAQLHTPPHPRTRSPPRTEPSRERSRCAREERGDSSLIDSAPAAAFRAECWADPGLNEYEESEHADYVAALVRSFKRGATESLATPSAGGGGTVAESLASWQHGYAVGPSDHQLYLTINPESQPKPLRHDCISSSERSLQASVVTARRVCNRDQGAL